MKLIPMIKRLLASLTILSVLALSMFAPIAQAQTTGAPTGQWWDQSFVQFRDKVNDPSNPTEIFGERYTRAQVSWIILSLIDILAGKVAGCAKDPDIVGCFQRAFTTDGSLGTIPSIALGIDALLSQHPASGIDYVASSVRDFKIVPEASAQGYGFQKSLVPVQKMWTITRNAAYALLTLAIIILGFMIMFRAKISPQASVTVQSAIPRVVVGMIFITFSYAIGGFIIDLGFLLLGMIAALITSVDGVTKDTVTAVSIFNSLNDGVQTVFGYAIAFILESFSGGGILSKLSRADALNQNVITSLLNPFRGIDTLLALIIMLLLVFALIRLFWVLLRTYVITILLIAAGPFVGVAYIAMPSGNMIGSWFKGLFANMIVFVSISVLILAAHIFFYGMGNGKSLINLEGFVNPNPFGIQAFASDSGVGRFPGGFGFENTAAIGFFVSLVLILSIPAIANQIRSYITSGKAAFGLDAGGAIGLAGAYGLGKTAGTGGLQYTASLQQRAYEGAVKSGLPIQRGTQKVQDVFEVLRRLKIVR